MAASPTNNIFTSARSREPSLVVFVTPPRRYSNNACFISRKPYTAGIYDEINFSGLPANFASADCNRVAAGTLSGAIVPVFAVITYSSPEIGPELADST